MLANAEEGAATLRIRVDGEDAIATIGQDGSFEYYRDNGEVSG